MTNSDPDALHELVHYAAMALENCADSMFITNPHGTIEWVNKGFSRLFGHKAAEIIGQNSDCLFRVNADHGDTQLQIMSAQSQRVGLTLEVEIETNRGQGIWTETSFTPIFDAAGYHSHYLVACRDISQRRAIEERAREAMENETYRQNERKLIGQISEWLYSAKSLDELLMVVEKSMMTLMPEADGALYIYPASRDALNLVSHWGDHAPPDQIDADDCWALRRGRAYSYGNKAINFKCAHAQDGKAPTFCLPIIAQGETIGLMHLRFSTFQKDLVKRAVIVDFLDQRWELALLCAEQISLAVANVQLRQKLQEQSIRDALTNLYNRRWLLDQGQKKIRQALGQKRPLSVISIDVDYFKKLNDAHGHDAGDAALRHVADHLKGGFRDGTIICRVGGEEFVALCPDANSESARNHAMRVGAKIAETPISYAGRILPPITVSQGVAEITRDGQTLNELLNASDIALYAAKNSGRNCVVEYANLPEQDQSQDGSEPARRPVSVT